MAEHKATITWSTPAAAGEFLKGRYSREHTWSFDGGVTFAGSSSPSVVPLPWSSTSAVDPEEAFVASIASYRDEAIGVMTKGANGTPWVSRVTLHPAIEWNGNAPAPAELDELHHHAHEQCFISNSVKTEIVVAELPPK